MPKPGDTLPYRIEFEWPPSARAPALKGTVVRHDAEAAGIVARDLRQRGASGQVIDTRDGRVIATFTPEEPADA